MIFISVLEPLKSEHVVPVVETDESFPSRLPFTTHNSNNDVHDVGGEEDKDDLFEQIHPPLSPLPMDIDDNNTSVQPGNISFYPYTY